MYEKYKYIYLLGIINLVLYIPRFYSTPILPCNEIFCSLMNDPIPRCIIIPNQHMTWSVPLGYTFNEIYLTPNIYTHFLFLFVFSFFVNPIKTIVLMFFVYFIKYYLIKSTNDNILDSSIAASVWCYVGFKR